MYIGIFENYNDILYMYQQPQYFTLIILLHDFNETKNKTKNTVYMHVCKYLPCNNITSGGKIILKTSLVIDSEQPVLY